MNHKEMREAIRAAGQHVPRSNEDVKAAYKALTDSTDNKELPNNDGKVVTLVNKNIYTYVGAGDEPPHMINFMGLQKFVRGKEVEVTNPEILAKIDGNPSFIKGKADPEKMFENDEKAKKKADAQRFEDQKMQIAMDRQNKG